MAYSDAEKTEAMVLLAVNRYNYKKTSQSLDIPVRTLRRWDKKIPKKGVDQLLERAIERLLMHIPSDMKGQDWAVAFGILYDKWLLSRGKPTERVESIFSTLQKLPDNELDELERQFTKAATGNSPNKG